MNAQQSVQSKKPSLALSSSFSFVWILLSIVFATSASLLNKKAAIAGKGEGILISLQTHWYVAALACLVLLACVWIMVLRHYPLSFAYPFMSSVRGFVLFGAWFLFQEPVYIHEILGMALLMSGIICIGMSRKL
jgi:multidrug transporter EmrE-like cation transporter